MVSHQPGMFGDHSCCGSEDMTYLVVEGQDSTRSLLNSLLQFISV